MKTTKTLIEDCFVLSTSLIKKDLQKARNKQPKVEGYLNFLHNGRSAALDYRIEYEDENTYLVIAFGPEPQRIQLAERGLTFGTRSYLVCGCGTKTNALYLKLDYFACRDCQKLAYKSTRINTKGDLGYFLQQNEKRLKLMDFRESMDRIIYRGKYTKRFKRFLKLCGKARMFREIEDAQKLMDEIEKSKSQYI